MRAVLLQDPLEIIFSLSFLITFHSNPQAVAHTSASLTLQCLHSSVHLKDMEAPLRNFGASIARVGRGQLEKVNS